MLNEKNERELCYPTKIIKVEPIPKYDKVELATTEGGWKVIVQKDEFEVGSWGIFCEIDSLVPAEEPFLFLEKRKYKIKTLKMCGVISQGILFSFNDFIDNPKVNEFTKNYIKETKEKIENGETKNLWLTKKLHIVHMDYVEETKEKQKSSIKKKNFFTFVKDLFLNGKNKTKFPTKFSGVRKTDQPRCEDYPFLFTLPEYYKSEYIETTKIDGTSTTFILEKTLFSYKFYVCSRNKRVLKPSDACFFSENVYWQVAEKFNIKEILKHYIKSNKVKWVAIQGETAGKAINGTAIQGNPHKFKSLRFFAFDMIDSKRGNISTLIAKEIIESYGLEFVPVTNEHYYLPPTIEEFKEHATGKCEAEGSEGNREGYVYHLKTNTAFSFKNVSKEYLLKHS